MPRKSKSTNLRFEKYSPIWYFLNPEEAAKKLNDEYPRLVYSYVEHDKGQDFTTKFQYYHKSSKIKYNFSFRVNMHMLPPPSLTHLNSATHSNPSSSSLMRNREIALNYDFSRVRHSIYDSAIAACANSVALAYHMPKISSYNSAIITCASIGTLITLVQMFSKMGSSFSSSLELSILGFSIYYLFSFLSTITKNKLDQASEQFEQILDEAENHLNIGKRRKADLKLTQLGLLQSILLHPKFPNKRELQWRFFYLNGRMGSCWGHYCRAESSYKLALALSRSDKEKFEILRLLIDVLHDKNIEMKAKHSPGYKTGIDEKIKKYFQQILALSDEYNKAINEVKTLLEQCLSNLIPQQTENEPQQFQDEIEKLQSKLFNKEQYKTACEIFDTIAWDGFLENIPNIAIPYYQTKILLTITNEYYPKYECFYHSTRWDAFSRDLFKIQTYANQFYPALAEKNKLNIQEMQKICPGKPTSLPHPALQIFPLRRGIIFPSLAPQKEAKKEEPPLEPSIIRLDEGSTLEKRSP